MYMFKANLRVFKNKNQPGGLGSIIGRMFEAGGAPLEGGIAMIIGIGMDMMNGNIMSSNLIFAYGAAKFGYDAYKGNHVVQENVNMAAAAQVIAAPQNGALPTVALPLQQQLVLQPQQQLALPAVANATAEQQRAANAERRAAEAAAEQRRVANAERRAAEQQRVANAERRAAEQQRVANAERRAAEAAAEQQRVANAEQRAANAAAEQRRVANAAAAAERADQVIRNNIEDLSRVQNNLDFQTRINAMEPDRIREVIARLQQRMGNNNPNAAGRFQAGQLLGRIRQAVAQRAIGQGGSKKHKSHRTIRRRKNNKRRTHKRV
jgi:hypothetical protein